MDAITLVDTVLDRSVVLGYGNTGFEIRRRLPGWPAGPTRMDGKSVLVTGAASGIGLAAGPRGGQAEDAGTRNVKAPGL
jgi:hypothetical protein